MTLSRETTEARFDLRAAEQARSTHRGLCAECAAARKDKRRTRCEEGAELGLAVRRATAEVERNKAEDAKPSPGQVRLW